MAALLSLPSCRVTCSKSDIPDYGMKEIETSNGAWHARSEIGNKLSAVRLSSPIYKYSVERGILLIGKNERFYTHTRAQ